MKMRYKTQNNTVLFQFVYVYRLQILHRKRFIRPKLQFSGYFVDARTAPKGGEGGQWPPRINK